MAPLITLITGCSTGIGLDLAVRLAQDPEKKYLVYATMRNLAKKDALEKAAGDALDKTLFIRQLDVISDDQVASIYDFIMEKHGRIDVLVNNAGLGYFGPLEAMPIEKAKSLFDTNFFGTVRMLQRAIPVMKEQRSGRIVNISSMVGHIAFPFMDMYNASKFAMEGLSETLWLQLKPFGISISTVQPGPVTTNFGKSLMANSSTSEEMNKNVSEDTTKLIGAVREHTAKENTASVQEPGPVIDIIVGCIEADKPRLRNPTSDAVRSMMAERYREEQAMGTEKMFEGFKFKL